MKLKIVEYLYIFNNKKEQNGYGGMPFYSICKIIFFE